MKKSFFIISLSMIALLVGGKIGVFQALLLFFLVGAVPGTTIVVPSSIMLGFIFAAAWLVVFRFTACRMFERQLLAYFVRMYNARKNHLSKHPIKQA